MRLFDGRARRRALGLAYGATEAILGRRFAYRLGRWLYLSARRESSTDLETDGELELQKLVVREVLKRSSKGGVAILDVGANVGNWSIPLARTLRGSEPPIAIHAFEPAPQQRQALLLRIAEEGLNEGFSVHAEGLSEQPGSVRFEITGSESGTSSLAPSDESRRRDTDIVEIDVSTVDEVIARERIDQIPLVKIDTEGHDFNVIKGASDALRAATIWVVQFEYGDHWLRFGFTLFDVFEFARSVNYAVGRVTGSGIELHSSWHPELERFIQANFVLVSPPALRWLPHRRVYFDRSNAIVVS